MINDIINDLFIKCILVLEDKEYKNIINNNLIKPLTDTIIDKILPYIIILLCIFILLLFFIIIILYLVVKKYY